MPDQADFHGFMNLRRAERLPAAQKHASEPVEGTLSGAFLAAKQARFEHGEKPR